MAPNDSIQPTRTPEQIEADLAAGRLRLSHAAEEFVDLVHPTRFKQRQIDGVKEFVGNEVDAGKALIFNAVAICVPTACWRSPVPWWVGWSS